MQNPLDTVRKFRQYGSFKDCSAKDESLRREINEGLSVIEQWNGATDFVFFARRGELTSNRREDHEVSMLS